MKAITKMLKPVAVGVMSTTTLGASDSWLNVQPAANLKDQSATLRFEGYRNLTPKLDIYGFADFYASQQEPVSLSDVYLETRLRYSLEEAHSLAKNFHLIPELSLGTLENRLKIGIGYHTSLWKGNYTTVRVFPYETSGKHGPHVTFFTMQSFMQDTVTASVVVDMNLKSRTAYIEPEISCRANKNLSLFIQGRSFGPLEKINYNLKDITPVLGFKYHF